MLNEGQEKAVNSTAEKLLVLAGAGTGKALKNGTGVLTPNGYVPIESLNVGDLVYAQNGKAYPVIGVYPQGKKPVYKITFNGGISIECNDEHLWFYQTSYQRGRGKPYTVGTLKEMMQIPLKKVSESWSKNNLYIPMSAPVEFAEETALPLDPYLLGYLIANGSLSNPTGIGVTTIHQDIVEHLSEICSTYGCKLTQYGGTITYGISGIVRGDNPILKILRILGLSGHTALNKFIPTQYLYASKDDRLRLLQGLFDGDGCNSANINEYSTSSPQLANDIVFLCESLGMTVSRSLKQPVYTYKGEKLQGATAYRLIIKAPKSMTQIYTGVHHRTRHQAQQCYARRYVKSIEPLGYEAEMTCISVASPDESFLTEHCIVTHNTHTMISRISRLVSDGVDVNSILVLTFTNAAATEMKERYKKFHPNESTPTFCTFHSFCYTLIASNSKVAQKLGYHAVPSIADDTALRKIATICRNQCSTKISDEKLKRDRDELSISERFQYDVYWKQYNKLLRQDNLITFDIMCYEVCKLFAFDDSVVAPYKARYKHIFIDEFQDTDPKQWEFASSFNDSNLFVVGDAKQAIYSFRGSDSSIIKTLAQSSDWETVKLSQNYRSTSKICDFANDIHTCWGSSPYNLDICSNKPGVDVEMRGSFSFDVETSMLHELFSTSDNSETTAILCRTNAEVSAIQVLLQTHGIPYRTKSSVNEELIGVLKSASDEEFMVDWLSNKLPSALYNEYIKFCAIDIKYASVSEFLKLYHKHNAIQKYADTIERVKSVLQSDIFSYQKCVDISKLLGLPQTVITLDSDSNESIINYLIQLAENQISNAKLYVGTIHSVKGLEYDNVHLLGVNGKSFPLKNEEQLNVYYVGCTRAKKRLIVWVESLYTI